MGEAPEGRVSENRRDYGLGRKAPPYVTMLTVKISFQSDWRFEGKTDSECRLSPCGVVRLRRL
jgi:hypothetical protein